MITSVREIPGGELPTNFSLEQNYPNPFNPFTSINYTIPTTSRVGLSIFNILGQQVARLVDEEQHAGKYRATFEASELPSGVYFYHASVGSFSMTRKMILMK
jgi:hypothetical protein